MESRRYCNYALLLIGDVPRSGKPHLVRRTRFVKNGARRHAGFMLAALAHQAVPAGSDGRTDNAASGANEFLRPAQLLKIVQAGLLSMKSIHELAPCFRVVQTGKR